MSPTARILTAPSVRLDTGLLDGARSPLLIGPPPEDASTLAETGAEIWVAPPNSDWHPLTEQMTAEQNAEMQAKMDKAAQDLKKKKEG